MIVLSQVVSAVTMGDNDFLQFLISY